MGLIITPVSDQSIVVTDNAANDASINAHGWRKKLTNVASSFQDETGAVKSTVVLTDRANTFGAFANDFTSATSLIVPVSAGYAPTANGSLGFDSTQKGLVGGGAGAIVGVYPRVLSVQNSTTDTLTAATINTTETQFASTFQIPANYLIANKAIRVTYLLQYTATATIPTSQFRLRLGAVGIGGTIVYSSTAAAIAAGGPRSSATSFLILGTAAAGASVAVSSTIVLGIGPLAANAQNQTGQTVNIATNAAQNINLTLQYSGNGASNTWTVLGMIVEELN